MNVDAEIHFDVIKSDYGGEVEGTIAICTRCDHATESAGVSGASVRRCLALLREECPRGEKNFYVGDVDD